MSMGDRSFTDHDPDGMQALQKRLVHEKNDPNLSAKHIEQLRGKLEHIIERADSPPDMIVAQIKVYTENRPELVRGDPKCIQLFKELLKCCKLTVKKTSMSQVRDSSSPLAVLVAKTLFTVYQDEPHWPLDLLELFMDDILGQRQWIDSSESVLLVKNLTCWTTSTERNIDCTITSTTVATSEHRTVTPVLVSENGKSSDVTISPKSDLIDLSEEIHSNYHSSDDESSGDEEVLEESSGRPADVIMDQRLLPPAKKIPDIYDRFSLTRDEAKAIVISLLTQKSGNGAGRQGQGNTSTSTVVIAMSCFCGLSEIRELSSNCMERWLGNPAIVDCVKVLLSRMAECLEVASEGVRVGDRGKTLHAVSTGKSCNHEHRTLIQSDLGVVREIVKLRYKLKASQLEFYRNTLILIAIKGMPVAKLIMRCMITADLQSGSSTVRGETVKLLLAILNAQHTLSVDTGGASGNSSSSSSGSRLSSGASKEPNISKLLGESLGELCYSALTNNSSDGEGTRDGEGTAALSVTPGSWTPVSSRLLLDLLLRMIRSVEGAKDLDYSAVLCGILGSPVALTDASATHRSNMERPVDTAENRAGQRGSRVHLLEWEVMTFFSDVAIALQLAIASDIIALEKAFKEKQQQMASLTSPALSSTAHCAGSATSSSGLGGHGSSAHGTKESSSAALSTTGGMAGMGAGRGMRGRGGGRGSSIASAPSSMFRGSAMRASAAVTMGSRGSGKQLGVSAAAQQTAVSTSLATTSDSTEGAPAAVKISNEELEERFGISRDAQWNKMLRVQEVACEWVSDLSAACDRQGSATDAHSVSKASLSAEEEPGEVVSGSGGDVDMSHLWLDWAQKACCLNHFRVTKVQADFDKNAPYHVRDNGIVSVTLLRAVLRLLLKTAVTTPHLMSGLTLLESMVHRAVKKGGAKGLTGILVTDVEIVRELFELSQVVLVPTGTRARKVPVLPALAVKALYWRVCTLCFTLGCARPESLGLFLWTAYPPVKSLMLMAISSRFSSSAESLAEEYVGTKESEGAVKARISCASGADRAPLGEVLRHTDSNGSHLYVTSEHVEARYSRVQDVEGALGRLEEAVGVYLFGEVPRPVSADADAVEVSESSSSNGKRVRSVAIDDLLAIQEERERQGQKRELERGARAERAAARLQRDALSPSPSLDSARAYGSSDSDSRSCGMEALLMLAGASSAVEGAVTLPRDAGVSKDTTSSSSSSSGTEMGAEMDTGAGDGGAGPIECVGSEIEPSVSLLKKRPRALEPAALAGEAPSSSSMAVAVTARVAGDTDALSDPLLQSEDLAVAVEEVRLAHYAMPSLSSSSAPPYSTTRGSVDAGDIMIMRCEGVSRMPPDDVIKSVRSLSVRFGFGAKLRSCTEPDFITRAISGEEVSGPESSSAVVGVGRGEEESTPRGLDAADVIDLTADPALRSRSTSTSTSSAAVLRVSRPAVEASFSWLVPAILEDADAILKRIPTAACLHLLLLGTLKSFTRLNMYGIWDQDPSLSPPTSYNTVRNGGSTVLLEVTKSNVLCFEDSSDLQLSLFEGSEHVSDVKFLAALAVKVRQHFPSSSLSPSSSASCDIQRKEQRGLLKVLLSDLQSSRQDRRATARFVLSFLGDSQVRQGSRCWGNPMFTAGLTTTDEVASAVHDTAAADGSDSSGGVASSSTAHRGRGAGESSVLEVIQRCFSSGPSLVDFTSFLSSACGVRPVPQRAPRSPGRAASDPPTHGPFRRQVTEAIRAAVDQEVDCSVLHQLLGLAHCLTPPSPTSRALAGATAAAMLLNLFVTRRLTADLFLSSLLRGGGAGFIAEILSAEMAAVKSFSSNVSAGATVVDGVDIILTRRGVGKEDSAFMNADTLRLLVCIACLIVRDCTEPSDSDPTSGCSDLIESASCILSCATPKDCKKLFLPLLAEALCAMPYPLTPCVDPSPSPGPGASRALYLCRPLITAMPPTALLDLLSGGGTGAGAGASSGGLGGASSGFPVECLRLIVDTLDSAVGVSSAPGAAPREAWQALVKQYSAKKIEKIQCELQPLVLSIIASAAACKELISQKIDTDMDVERRKDSAGRYMKSEDSQRSWALNSVSLSSLFTLAELQSVPTPPPLPVAVPVPNSPPAGDALDDPTDGPTHDPTDGPTRAVPMDCEDSAGLSDQPPSVPATSEASEEVPSLSAGGPTGPGVASQRAMVLFGSGVTFAALQQCCDAISAMQREDSAALALSLALSAAHDEEEELKAQGIERGKGGERGREVDRRVLSWSLDLLKCSFSQSRHVCSTAVHCLSSALLSCHKEETLFALALTGSGSCHADAVEGRDTLPQRGRMSSGRRWCVFALMLSPLLSREKEQALGAFQRGLSVLKALTLGTGGADGSVLFLLLRQLLSLLVEDLSHRSGGQLVDSLHLNEGRDRRINHLQKNSKASRRIISKLLPSISDFVSILNLNQNQSADRAGKARAADEDPAFWDRARLQGYSFSESGTERDPAPAGREDSSSAIAASAEAGPGAKLHVDNLTGREMMRRESQRFLNLIVLSEESSSRLWSHLTFYPHTGPVT